MIMQVRKRLLAITLALLLMLSSSVALARTCKHGKPCGNSCIAKDKTCHSSVAHNSHGKIERSKEARLSFQKTHPCPSTGKTGGTCPGYVVDCESAPKVDPAKSGCFSLICLPLYILFAGVTIGADRGPGGVRNFNGGLVSCVQNPEGSLANADSQAETRIVGAIIAPSTSFAIPNAAIGAQLLTAG
jgi:hypothetical protein